MSIENYTLVERPHGSCLLHNTNPVWIVEYCASRVRPRHWQTYKAIHKVPKDRDPWSIDNRRLGHEDGVATLEEAIALGDAA